MTRTISGNVGLAALFVMLASTLVLDACSSDETAADGPTTGPAASASGSGASGAQGGATSSSATTGGGGSGGTGGSTLHDCNDPSGSIPPLQLTSVASGFNEPVLALGAPGDASRLFVVEREGLIHLLINDAQQTTPYLDITAITTTSGDRGLLGVAFHPDYQTNGRFFVHYGEQGSGDSVIAEFAVTADPNVADPNPVGEVLRQSQPAGNHNGGSIGFGADGMLYIPFGDGGSQNDPNNNGQNNMTWLSAILRVDVTTLPYQIPSGNMSGVGILPEIWSHGLRNPWRSSFDLCTGDLYIGDVGQNQIEEIDVEPAGQGNRNYGWRLMEGSYCFNPMTNCDPNNITTLPALEYDHNEGCSVTGGYVYRGSAIPALRGRYLYGDFCGGRIWSFAWDGSSATDNQEHTQDLMSAGIGLVSFGQDSSGEVYVIDYSGDLYRIEPE